MGRPLNKKYFGSRNIGSITTTADDKIGGSAVGTVAVSGTFSGKTTSTAFTIPTSVISAPDLPFGIKPTLAITFSSATTGTVTVVDGGSGYINTATITGAALQALGGGTGTVVLTSTLAPDTGAVGSATNQENAIIMTAFLTGGSAVTVDIIKQVSSRRYRVTDGTRTGVVTLTGVASGSLTAGQCNIVATDAASGTYFVTKLTARKATLKRGTGTVYVDATTVGWTFGTATATVCKIPNA
jgi:hypothetical protein